MSTTNNINTEDQLFPVPVMTPSQRPEPEQVYAAVAREVAKSLVKWSGWPNSTDIDELAEEIVSAMEDTYGDLDGYALAKELEREHGWKIRSEFVEELDCDHQVSQRLRALWVEWVKTNNIQPGFSVGDTVTVKPRGKAVEGAMQDLRPDGTCAVKVGEMEGAYIIKWEDVVFGGKVEISTPA